MWAATRLEKTLRREELEAILTSNGLDADSALMKWELADAREPGDLVVVDVADRDSILTKVCGRLAGRCGRRISAFSLEILLMYRNLPLASL